MTFSFLPTCFVVSIFFLSKKHTSHFFLLTCIKYIFWTFFFTHTLLKNLTFFFHFLTFNFLFCKNRHLQIAANAGDASALYMMGKFRLLGLFVRPDAKKAHALFTKSAQAGNPMAKRMMARMSMSGIGIQKSCVRFFFLNIKFFEVSVF